MRRTDTSARRVFMALIIVMLVVTMLAALSACTNEGGSDTANIIVYGGYITGTENHTGSFAKNTQISVSANEPEGKVFECWKKGETIVSQDNPYTFVISSDITLTAVFREANPIPVYTVTVVNGHFLDTGKNSGIFKEGTEVTVKADVPEGKRFVQWNNGAQIVAAADPYTFTVNSNIELTAIFNDSPKYNLSIIGGTYNGATSAVVTDGGEVSIIPDEREGYVFSGWDVNGTKRGAENPLKIKITANTTVKAEFKALYSLKINRLGTTDTETHADGESVTVRADTNVAGYEFLRWISKNNELLGKNASYTFKISHDTEITALYRSLPASGGKTITAVGCTIYSDSACTQPVGDGHNITDYTAGTYYIKADHAGALTLEKISYFNPGSDLPDVVLGTASTLERQLDPSRDGDIVYYALYSTNFNVSVTGGGTIKGGGTEKTVREYDSVTVTAPALSGKRFLYWKLNGEPVMPSTAEQSFVITSNTILEAVYVNTFTVTITNPMDDPTLNVATYDEGTYVWVTIDSIPHENMVFYRWTDGEGNHYTGEKLEIPSIDKNWTLTAEFKRVYLVNVENADGTGTYTTSQTYVEGEIVNLSFVRADEVPAALAFRGWSFDDGQTLFSTSETASFTVDKNVTVVAVLENVYTQEAVLSYSDSESVLLKYPNLASPTDKKFETSFILPGLKMGQNFMPQGIAYLKNYKAPRDARGKDYALVTGYISSQNTAGISNSMLFVMDMSGRAFDSSASYRNGKLIKEIFLLNEDGSPYTGFASSVAVTDNNVYISADRQVLEIPLLAIMNAKSSAFVRIAERIDVPVAASFLSYADGVLWVGETVNEDYAGDPSHQADGYTAWTVGYKINVNERSGASMLGAEVIDGVAIPDHVLRHGNNVRSIAVAGNKIAMSTSTGRTNKSRIYVYKNQVYNPTNGLGSEMLGNKADSPGTVTIKGKAVPYWDLTAHEIMLEVPPMVRGLAVYKDTADPAKPSYKLFIVNESASDRYLNGSDGSGKASDPVGCAWMIDIAQSIGSKQN